MKVKVVGLDKWYLEEVGSGLLVGGKNSFDSAQEAHDYASRLGLAVVNAPEGA